MRCRLAETDDDRNRGNDDSDLARDAAEVIPPEPEIRGNEQHQRDARERKRAPFHRWNEPAVKTDDSCGAERRRDPEPLGPS